MDLLGESGGGAIDANLDVSAQGYSLRFFQFIEDSSSDIFDEALKLNGVALFIEVSAALVAGVRREQCAVSGECMKGEQSKEADDLYEYLGDLDIGIFS